MMHELIAPNDSRPGLVTVHLSRAEILFLLSRMGDLYEHDHLVIKNNLAVTLALCLERDIEACSPQQVAEYQHVLKLVEEILNEPHF